MRCIGLTGGIASGKSTVAQLLRRRGEEVLDADVLAREVVEPATPGLSAVVHAFGSTILDAAGALDRPKLGALIFSDAEKRRQLSAIIHPLVAQAFADKVNCLAERDVPRVIYEVPLLFENGLESGMDATLLVALPEDLQRQRLMARDHLDEQQAQARINAQMSLAEKRCRANFIIENAGSLDTLADALNAVWPRVINR